MIQVQFLVITQCITKRELLIGFDPLSFFIILIVEPLIVIMNCLKCKMHADKYSILLDVLSHFEEVAPFYLICCVRAAAVIEHIILQESVTQAKVP